MTRALLYAFFLYLTAGAAEFLLTGLTILWVSAFVYGGVWTVGDALAKRRKFKAEVRFQQVVGRVLGDGT